MQSSIETTCRVQNPNTPHARRVRAAHGGAAGHGEAGQKDGMPTVRSAQKTTVPVSDGQRIKGCRAVFDRERVRACAPVSR